MKGKVQGDNRVYLYHVLCVLAGAVTLFPISCNYILGGDLVTEWIGRVEELALGFQNGLLYLFPSAEMLARLGIKVNGMNSNLWFFIPGLLYKISGNMVFAYRIYMLAVQLGTLFAAIWMFRRIFADRETRLPVFFGVLLYMTCPYRIYICYDYANLSQAAAWMLVPLYVWAVMGEWKKERLENVAVAALVLAGIGYADTMFFLTLAGVTILVSLVWKQWWLLLCPAAGGIFFLPGLYRLFQYLFADGFQDLDMPLESIMQNGYRVGEFFSSYAFRDGHPGMGLGILICLLVGGWMAFVDHQRPRSMLTVDQSCSAASCGECKFFAGLSGFFVLLSLASFPWDFVQRIGFWSLKLVSLINTPAVFWGMALFCFSVPAACVVNRISRHENKLMAYAVPIIVMIVCLWVCVYQCNTLMYTRMPLD